MPITRTFLDWSEPALPAAAQHLIARRSGEDVANLSDLVVVLPGSRACRRLLELLVEQTDNRLVPPAIITEGTLPEHLYEPQRPFAGRLAQQLAWGEAVRRQPRSRVQQMLRDVPADEDVDGWTAVGELLWSLHRELSAEQLDFGDVLAEGERAGRFVERNRWQALRAAQQEYLEILDSLHLWDRQTARLVAIDRQECRTEKDVILVGTVDLNRTTRAMLDQISDRVTALIHAPPSLANRFDEHGCLKPDEWNLSEIDVPDERLRVAEGPAEQADEVVRVLSSFDGRYRADDVTIGLADESLVVQLLRRLRQFDVPARWVVGKTLPQTAIFRLLESARAYLEDGSADQFAGLVRHPDVTLWLQQAGLEPIWLDELDRYLSEHLQEKLGFWLGGSGQCMQVRQAYDEVTALLAALKDAPRTLAEWSEAILQLPLTIFGDREFDPEQRNDRAETDAFDRLQSVLAEHAALPETLMPVVSGAQALQLTLDALRTESVPPPRDDAAVELLGWLELPLDDAPALVVTSFNEQYVPSSVDADLFLPNQARQQLGVLDNDRRYARDAYALSALLASRENVTLIAGRRNGRGDPLLPSRLVLAGDDAAIARRIEQYFTSASSSTPLLPPLAVDAADTDRRTELVVPRPRPLEVPKHSFSVTALKDYLACPYRFYLKHVLRLGQIDDEADELSPPQFGTLLHNVLSDFGESDLKHSSDPDEICDFLAERLDERAAQLVGRRRPPAISVQIEQGRTRLRAFADWQADRAAAGWVIEFVEQPGRDQAIELPVDEGRSLTLHGRIDRIDRHPDGRWAIFDYKTGDDGKSPEQTHRKGEQWIDLQLPLYRELAGLLGVSGNVELGYINLSGDTKSDVGQPADWSEADLASALETATEVARKILDQQFLPLADRGEREYDDFAAICQQGVFERRPPE